MTQKISIVLQVLLAIAVGYLLVNHWSAADKDATGAGAPSSSAPEEFALARIAYIQYDSLVNRYELHRELKSKLEREAQALRQEMEKRGRVFQENVQVLQDQADQLSEAELQQAQMELQQKQQEIMSYRQEGSEKLAQQQEELTALLREDLTVVLDSLKDEYELDFIVSYDASSDVLAAGQEYNITETVVQALNDNYQRKDSMQIGR